MTASRSGSVGYRQLWARRVTLFVLFTGFFSVIAGISDSMRPPYVTWRFEAAAGAFAALVLLTVCGSDD